MIRLSKLADYAMVVLFRLSAAPEPGEGVQTSPGIASATGVPEPTVAKVLKLLTAASLVHSHRGARGGYRLARGLEDISVADVITAVDGPIALTACVAGAHAVCGTEGSCALRGRWKLVNDAIRRALDGITLAEMFDEPLAGSLRMLPALPVPALQTHAE
jgi:FeS assembly SUF system regulator